MTLSGAPEGMDLPPATAERIFDHIPRLDELLPKTYHLGVIYAQVCVHNMKNAADRTSAPAHFRKIRHATYYTIEGPKGASSMSLVGTGSPINGTSPESGCPHFFTDIEVERETGHKVQYPIILRDVPLDVAEDLGFEPPTEEQVRTKRKYKKRRKKTTRKKVVHAQQASQPDTEPAVPQAEPNPPSDERLSRGPVTRPARETSQE